jgi:hypothetical protein
MTRKQLEKLRDGVKAQIRRASLHHGDHELMNLPRMQGDHHSARIPL